MRGRAWRTPVLCVGLEQSHGGLSMDQAEKLAGVPRRNVYRSMRDHCAVGPHRLCFYRQGERPPATEPADLATVPSLAELGGAKLRSHKPSAMVVASHDDRDLLRQAMERASDGVVAEADWRLAQSRLCEMKRAERELQALRTGQALVLVDLVNRRVSVAEPERVTVKGMKWNGEEKGEGD